MLEQINRTDHPKRWSFLCHPKTGPQGNTADAPWPVPTALCADLVHYTTHGILRICLQVCLHSRPDSLKAGLCSFLFLSQSPKCHPWHGNESEYSVEQHSARPVPPSLAQLGDPRQQCGLEAGPARLQTRKQGGERVGDLSEDTLGCPTPCIPHVPPLLCFSLTSAITRNSLILPKSPRISESLCISLACGVLA